MRFAIHFLADCALIRGECAEAERRYRESLREALELGDVIETSAEVQGIAMANAGAFTVPASVTLGDPAGVSFAFSGTATGSHTYGAIGPYAVGITITDDGGSTTGALGSTMVVSPVVTLMQSKQALLAELQAAAAAATRKHDRDELKEAIRALQKSLDPKLWLDGNHLQPKHGGKVFDRERHVVHEFVELLRDKHSLISHSTLMGWIDTVESIDQELAQVEIDDATAAGGNSHQLSKAAQEMAHAAKDLAKGHYEQAIGHYKQAWKHAEESLKHH